MNSQEISVNALIRALDKRIEFHRTNTNDPYNLGNAAILILEDVKSAIKESTVTISTNMDT